MIETQPKLMAVEPLPQGDWLLQVKRIFVDAGMHIEQRRSSLLVWDEVRRVRNLKYADGWSIRRVWLAPRRSAIGVMSRRIYFLNDISEIDRRPEWVIVSGNRPQPPDATSLIQSQWEILDLLQESIMPAVKPVSLQLIESNLVKSRSVCIGSNSFTSPPDRLTSLYQNYGFDDTPKDFTVSICPVESVTQDVAEEFARRLSNVGCRWNVRIKVKLASISTIERRIAELQNSSEGVRKGRCLLFVLPSKMREPQAETLSLFKSLEECKVPFRRAHSDDPLEYSIPDQLPSLVMAAGGRPHRSPMRSSGRSIWSVGVDLGHPSDGSESILALTLVDPDGGFVDAWTTMQPRDETARVESISGLLEHCRRELDSLERHASVMVLRDGRTFENENGRLYQDILGPNVSYFEYRKRGNPQIIYPNGQHVKTAGAIAALLPDNNTLFVVTVPPRNDRMLSSVAKVVWRDDWNNLGLEPVEIASILATSATAPGLGLHSRHLPTPIYWADGIAGANDKDIRFRGVKVNRV